VGINDTKYTKQANSKETNTWNKQRLNKS